MKKIFLLLICVISIFIFNTSINAFTLVKEQTAEYTDGGYSIYKKTKEDGTLLYCLSGINISAYAGSGYIEINENNATEVFEKIAEIQSRKTAFKKIDEV